MERPNPFIKHIDNPSYVCIMYTTIMPTALEFKMYDKCCDTVEIIEYKT